MHFSPRSAYGFKIDEDTAENLGLRDEFAKWKKDGDESAFADAFRSKFKPPEGYYDIYIREFQYERGGEVQGLSGFDWNQTYVTFDDIRPTAKGWRPFSKKMSSKYDIYFEEGEWTQLT